MSVDQTKLLQLMRQCLDDVENGVQLQAFSNGHEWIDLPIGQIPPALDYMLAHGCIRRKEEKGD